MKKIVVEFIRGLSDGGAETLVKEYCSLIDKSQFEVIVVVLFSKKESANYKVLKQNGIKIIELYDDWGSVNRIKYKLLGNYYIPLQLRKIIKQYNPVAIHIHMTVLRFVAKISKHLKNINLFYTCHSTPERYLGKTQKKEYYAVKKLITGNNLVMIGLTNEMAKELNDMFNVNNSIVIRNGIDFDRFNLSDNKADICASLGIPEKSFVVGHVGRFHPIKNHVFLVSVFEQIQKIRPDAFLLMVGQGEEKDHIKAILHEKGLDGKYLILSNRSDVPRLLKAMDVFVFCSTVEGFGIAVIEAQLAGVRCLVSDSVPKDTLVTDLAISLNLRDGAEKWAEIALQKEFLGKGNGKLLDYNMRVEIKKLERLYEEGII